MYVCVCVYVCMYVICMYVTLKNVDFRLKALKF